MTYETNLISIISPVFNTGKYIKQCIQSVLKQTYGDWELIFVIDASPDNSLDIIKLFAQQDERIKFIVNEHNLGVSKTRFKGLEIAKGEFIMHLDSDDWLPQNALLSLVEKIKSEKADIVYGGFVRVMDKMGIIKKNLSNNYSEDNIIDPIVHPELFEDYFISYFGVNKLYVSMCGKLYRHSVIKSASLAPTEMFMGEDLLYNLQLHPFLKKIAFVSNPVYFYRYGGITTRENPTFLIDIKKQFYIKKNKIEAYKYDKALPFIQHELVNCFFSHFLKYALLEIGNKEQLKLQIEEELLDPIYDQELNQIKNLKSTLLKEKNVDALTDLIWKQYQKSKYTFKFKKLISSILN